MKEQWDNKESRELFEAIATLKTPEETKRFLRDLLTPQEIAEFSKRWTAARMLAQGKSYSQVEKKTGLSSTTVARVSLWLNQGLGGYGLILRRSGIVHHHTSPLAGRG